MESKPPIREELIAARKVHLYFKTESKGVLRTNNKCVVVLLYQWYLAYREDS